MRVYLLSSAILLAVVLQIPQFLRMSDPRFQGVLVKLNSDEEVYRARVEEALTGRPEQSDEAFTGDETVHGTQAAILERTVGTVFAPTGLSAPAVLQILDAIVAIAFFLCLFLFFRECGFSHVLAYGGTVAFCLFELYNLNRPIHQGLSTLFVLLAITCTIAGARRHWWFLGIIGSILLGATFGDYLWSWSFAWGFMGLYVLWSLLDGESRKDRRHLLMLGTLLVFALLITSPFVLQMLKASENPHYADAIFRSGIHPSRLPESWPYTILFTAMLGGVLVALAQKFTKLRPHRVAVITIITAFICIHQQVIHGITFNFVSHYLFFLIIAAIGVVLLFITRRTIPLGVAAVAACIYLAAIGWDGRFIVSHFRVNANDFSEQHLASALPVLNALPRLTILSDPSTEMFLASFTKHDVVYSIYMKNALVSNEELARRYCMSVALLAPEKRDLDHQVLIWPDADGAFKDNPSVREREVELVKESCAALDKEPSVAFDGFSVAYIFWNEKTQPEWNLRRLGVQLMKVASGDGWSLWKRAGML